jgi:microcystin-dependent protein
MSWSSNCFQTFPVPVGSVLFFAGTSIPNNYLLANGDSVLISDYPDLFDVIGTEYGSVDANHFNLPDLITYPYMKGTDTFNPTPSGAGIPGLNYSLPLNALPTLTQFSHAPVANWATGNVAGTAISRDSETQPNGLVTPKMILASSHHTQFGASLGSFSGSINYTNNSQTPVDVTFGGTYYPDNLGLMPCIRCSNNFPINPVLSVPYTPNISTINNPNGKVPNLSGFIYSQ